MILFIQVLSSLLSTNAVIRPPVLKSEKCELTKFTMYASIKQSNKLIFKVKHILGSSLHSQSEIVEHRFSGETLVLKRVTMRSFLCNLN